MAEGQKLDLTGAEIAEGLERAKHQNLNAVEMISGEAASFEPLRVVDYIVVEADDCTGLTKCVMQKLEDGFQPQGGIAVRYEEMGCRKICIQAMVKYSDSAEDQSHD